MALDRTSETQVGQVGFAVKTTEVPLSSSLEFKLHTQKPNSLKKVQLPLVSAWKWGIQCNKWKQTQTQAGHWGTLKRSRLKSKTFQIPVPLAVCSHQMIARGQRQGLQLWVLPRDPSGWQQQRQQQEVPRARFWAGPVPRRAGHPSGPTEWCAEGRKRLSFTQEHCQAEVQTRWEWRSNYYYYFIFFFLFSFYTPALTSSKFNPHGRSFKLHNKANPKA